MKNEQWASTPRAVKSAKVFPVRVNECLICDTFADIHRKWYMRHIYNIARTHRIYVKPHTNRSQIKPCVFGVCFFFIYHDVAAVRAAFLHNHSWVDAHINAIFFTLVVAFYLSFGCWFISIVSFIWWLPIETINRLIDINIEMIFPFLPLLAIQCIMTNEQLTTN